MARRTPQRFTARVSGVPRRVARVAEGAVDTDGRFGDTIDPNTDGRLEVRIPSGGGLKKTSRGLELTGPLGDKTLIKMIPIDDLAATPTVGQLSTTVNEILQAMRDTFRMRTI